MKSVFVLKGIVLTSLALVIVTFLSYRTAAFPLGLEALESLISALILTAILLFLWKAKFKWLNNDQDRNVKFGLYFGLLWTVEIGINNIIRPGLPQRDFIDDSFWVAIALFILLFSIYSANKTKKISQGIVSGFWTGLASGAVACLTALLLIVFGMSLILNDPLNIKEWADVKSTTNLPGMAVYFAYQTLAGAIMHLVIPGAVMGLLLGFIGGVIGKTSGILRK